MKRLVEALVITALIGAALTPVARADFGFKEVEVIFSDKDGSPAMLAGSHPFAFKNTFEVNVDAFGQPEGSPKDLEVDLPPGFVADPTAVPRCSAEDFLTLHLAPSPIAGQPLCEDSTALGFIGVKAPNEAVPNDFAPVYNLAPPPGKALKLGFRVLNSFITVTGGLRSGGDYNAFAALENTAQIEPFVGSELTIWGNPADPAHDAQRGSCFTSSAIDSCPAGIAVRPFLTLPRSCTGRLLTIFKMRSWQDQGTWVERKALTPATSNPLNPQGLLDCPALNFGPNIAAEPTTNQADSPSGLDFNLDINDKGLTSPDGRAHSDVKKAVVTLPEGMTVNPSQAEGLAVCSEADLKDETATSEPGEGCPQASKIGTVEVESPLLEGEILKGSLFVAEPYRNRFGTLIALYMTIKSRELGVSVSLAGKVEPDPETGQLITTFDDLPQLPFSHFRLHFREGGRSPLVTPPRCGEFTTEAVFTPWANPSSPYTTDSTFTIGSGVGGGPCPAGGTPPFQPGFTAGTINNAAGSFSPFFLRLTRRDGDQDLTRFSSTMPPGLLAKLAGTSRCPDGDIAAAKSKTGMEELASPSCPASSQIGRVLAGAGVGSQLTYVPGKLYLSGPVGGAPLSLVSIVPAVAGPFDVGTVVTRVALQINPRTIRVRADGANSDPIPHILAGIPLRVRDIRAYVDRPNFMLNPTSCNPFSVGAELWGGGSNAFTTADDSPVSLAVPFQAADCASLGFKPRLSFRLKGGTKRGGHPALRGVFRPRPGDANLSGLVVRLPRSAFLDQAHIRTICTRVQFAAKNCPEGAIYGRATVFTPLLDEPLQGPIYLRSSNNKLPDFVVALHGIIDAEVVARIDSKKGGIRATFEEVPDAPIAKVVVEMQGGKKGLIVNSRNLCLRESRADVRMTGHNGKRHNVKPSVRADCKGKRTRKR